MRTAGSRRRAVCPTLLALVLACLHPWPAGAQDLPEAPPGRIAAAVAVPAAQDHRLAGWTVVAGSYAVMAGYSYYSWYQEDNQRDFYVADDGWFGRNTYAGGADKLGHCFSSYVIARAGYDVLSWAGLSRNQALTASLALDALFFTAIEIKDGKTENLGFSWGDVAANLFGNLLAAAFVLHPPLDRSLDFRLEYYPSREYLDAVSRTGTINAVEDYTGMTFGLWYHLSELPGLKERPALAWLRFVDVGLTYGARNYRPEPDGDRPPERELSAALTLNVAAIVRAFAADRAPRIAGASDWVFEYFTVPKTTLEAR